ncbi:hypothetical protein LAZ67_X002009, partial [Cordylochernes scorpioides]
MWTRKKNNRQFVTLSEARRSLTTLRFYSLRTDTS